MFLHPSINIGGVSSIIGTITTLYNVGKKLLLGSSGHNPRLVKHVFSPMFLKWEFSGTMRRYLSVSFKNFIVEYLGDIIW